jgi:hypothetical protein
MVPNQRNSYPIPSKVRKLDSKKTPIFRSSYPLVRTPSYPLVPISYPPRTHLVPPWWWLTRIISSHRPRDGELKYALPNYTRFRLHVKSNIRTRSELVGLGVMRCYIVCNITASATVVIARCHCYRHLLATISIWDEVPLPRPPEESLSCGGVQAVCSMEANTHQQPQERTALLGELIRTSSEDKAEDRGLGEPSPVGDSSVMSGVTSDKNPQAQKGLGSGQAFSCMNLGHTREVSASDL